MTTNLLFFLAAFVLTFAPPVFGADSCVTTACHSAIGSLAYPHEPVKEGDCSSCHRRKAKEHPVKGAKAFVLTYKGGELCSQCHEAKGKGKVVHQPVKDGECTSCHRPHGAANRYLLDVGTDQAQLCLGCHEDAPFKMRYKHGPAAVGQCTRCHDPHESQEKAMLKEPVRNVCLGCHADFASKMNESAVVHPPVKNGPCTTCHNPHGSAVQYYLQKKTPDLCVECHTAIGSKLAGVKVPHKPVIAPGSCINCHSAHFSKAKGLLPVPEMEMCLGCHDTDNLGQPPLRNIKKDLEGKKYLHGPIRKGDCKACHDPHGSNYFRMLRGEYPPDLYAPYKEGIYGACLICHNKNLLRHADTTVDTNFRNGSRNLHFVHVSRDQKGRTCRICHEPHASNGVKLIRVEGIPFGDWNIPINFKITATGGSCAPGCHRPLKYDRVAPENYK